LGSYKRADQEGHESRVYLGWELFYPNLNINKNSRNFIFEKTVGKEYVLSWGSGADLRRDIESWRGKKFTDQETLNFDLKKVLGAWCILLCDPAGVGDDLIIREVKSGSSSIKNLGDDMPKPIESLEYFNVNEPDWSLFQRLTRSLQEKIQISYEGKRLKNINKLFFENVSNIDFVNYDNWQEKEFSEEYKYSANGKYFYIKRTFFNGQELFWRADVESYPLDEGEVVSRRAYLAVKGEPFEN
jgi:hypothetical protein